MTSDLESDQQPDAFVASIAQATVLIIGLGMIGASLAQALKRCGAVANVIALTRNQQELQVAVQQQVVDRGVSSLEQGMQAADIVILCTPVGTYTTLFQAMKPYVRPRHIISDVGSAKACVLQAAQAVFEPLPTGLVPAHPIAGSEKSGPRAAEVALFQDRKLIITPHPQAAPKAVALLTELWQSTGAEVCVLDALAHDRILAATSHLPHLLAFTLVSSLSTHYESDRPFEYAAGGFRDFTRIAASSPQMWADIFTLNTPAIMATAEQFLTDLKQILALIDSAQHDPQAMQQLISQLTQVRQQRQDFEPTVAR